MAKKKRKQKKNPVRLGSIVVVGIALLASICIHQLTSSTQLPPQAKEAIEVATKKMEELKGATKEMAKDITKEYTTEKTKESSSHPTAKPSQSNTLKKGIEIPISQADDTRILSRTGFTISYHDTWKMPQWVAWYLTTERVEGKEKRTDDFLTDPDLPTQVLSEDSDYRNSRYDRGHMAPAGDMKWNEQAMIESFYMSNICPQAPNLNRGDWRILEENCRKWAQEHQTPLYIVCGPLVESEKKHKRIGKNKVTVPDGFFKVVLKLGDEPAAVGFLFPNDDCDEKLAEYAVSVDSVEKVTGFDFFHLLPDKQEKKLEAIIGFDKF